MWTFPSRQRSFGFRETLKFLSCRDADVKWVEVDGVSRSAGRLFYRRKKQERQVSRIPLNTEARSVAMHQLNDATVSQFVFPSNKTRRYWTIRLAPIDML